MKQVILMREDVDMSRGKSVAQGSHASVLATRKVEERKIDRWISENAGTKITLSVPSESELRNLIESAKESGLPTSIISDLGRTEIEEGTTTAGAIGPAEEAKIDELTGTLSLYK